MHFNRSLFNTEYQFVNFVVYTVVLLPWKFHVVETEKNWNRWRHRSFSCPFVSVVQVCIKYVIFIFKLKCFILFEDIFNSFL